MSDAQQNKLDIGIRMLVVGLLAWALPGAGHIFIKEFKRGLIIFVAIVTTFLVGLYIGSIAVIDPAHAKPWYMAQILASPAVAFIGKATVQGEYAVFGKPAEIGQIYTTVAGLLNLLCIVSAVYMAYCGRGEMIGKEESND